MVITVDSIVPLLISCIVPLAVKVTSNWFSKGIVWQASQIINCFQIHNYMIWMVAIQSPTNKFPWSFMTWQNNTCPGGYFPVRISPGVFVLEGSLSSHKLNNSQCNVVATPLFSVGSTESSEGQITNQTRVIHVKTAKEVWKFLNSLAPTTCSKM